MRSGLKKREVRSFFRLRTSDFRQKNYTMPIITTSSYQPPAFLFNGHMQTIIPSQFRVVRGVTYTREKIETDDHDFLLLDWSKNGSNQLAVISHGLEGDSYRGYIRGMARAFNRAGYDALAWNFRGCGGQMNDTLRFYHSGATADLDWLLRFVSQKHHYRKIVLIGFSLGGNLTLKYLGEQKDTLLPAVQKAVVFSVPLDLHGCAQQISTLENFIYNWRFLSHLKRKIRQKARRMPDLSPEPLARIKTLKAFDDFYTAPLHGFKDAEDYYAQCSSLFFLNQIRIPTLIVNAQNDPFLSEKCYFTKDTPLPENLWFEAPRQGGHCGFMPKLLKKDQNFWSEDRAVAFCEQ